MTTVDGRAEVTGLALGNYYYQETKAPDGYIVDDTLKQFTLSAEELVFTAQVENTKEEEPPVEPPTCTQFVMKNLQPGQVLKVNGETMTVPKNGQLTLPVGEFTDGVYVMEVFDETDQLFGEVKVTEDCIVSVEFDKKCDVVIEEINWLSSEPTTTYIVSFEEGITVIEGDKIFVNGKEATVVLDENGELTVDLLEEGEIERERPQQVSRVASLFAITETVGDGESTSGDAVTIEPEPPQVPDEPEQSEVPSNPGPQPKPQQETPVKEKIGYLTVSVTDGATIVSGDEVMIGNEGPFSVNDELSLDKKALNEAELYEGVFELTVDGVVVGTVRLVEECTVEPPIVDPPDPPKPPVVDPPDRPDPPNPPVVDPPDPPRPNPPTPRPPDDDDDDDGGGGSSTPPVITPPTPVEPPDEEEPVEEEPPPTDTEEEFEVVTPPANTSPPVEEEPPPTDTEEEFEVVTPPANTPTIEEEPPTVPPSRSTVVTTTRTVTVAPSVSNVYSSSPRLPQTDGAANNVQLLGYMLLATMFGIVLIRRRRQQKR